MKSAISRAPADAGRGAHHRFAAGSPGNHPPGRDRPRARPAWEYSPLSRNWLSRPHPRHRQQDHAHAYHYFENGCARPEATTVVDLVRRLFNLQDKRKAAHETETRNPGTHTNGPVCASAPAALNSRSGRPIISRRCCANRVTPSKSKSSRPPETKSPTWPWPRSAPRACSLRRSRKPWPKPGRPGGAQLERPAHRSRRSFEHRRHHPTPKSADAFFSKHYDGMARTSERAHALELAALRRQAQLKACAPTSRFTLCAAMWIRACASWRLASTMPSFSPRRDCSGWA